VSASWIAVVAVLVAAFGLAFVIGRLLTLRAGLKQGAAQWPPLDDADIEELELSRSGPTVLHFSAVWCGPCAGVRRVVEQVCADLPAVSHVEIDLDAKPEAGRKLSVLSLPTTFIFDADGRQRYRSSGVPTAADLRAALQALLA
jgi:thiol-disulfide isomerase/thioredoxin